MPPRNAFNDSQFSTEDAGDEHAKVVDDEDDELFAVSDDEPDVEVTIGQYAVEQVTGYDSTTETGQDAELQDALFGVGDDSTDAATDGHEDMVSTVNIGSIDGINAIEADEDSNPIAFHVPFANRRSSVVTPAKPAAPITVVAAPPSSQKKNVLASSVHSEASNKQSRKRKGSETSGKDASATVRVATLTVPNTPNLRAMKRTRSERKMSSTTMELQRIAQEREEIKKQKAKYAKVYAGVKTTATTGATSAVPRSVKPLTQVTPVIMVDDVTHCGLCDFITSLC